MEVECEIIGVPACLVTFIDELLYTKADAWIVIRNLVVWTGDVLVEFLVVREVLHFEMRDERTSGGVTIDHQLSKLNVIVGYFVQQIGLATNDGDKWGSSFRFTPVQDFKALRRREELGAVCVIGGIITVARVLWISPFYICEACHGPYSVVNPIIVMGCICPFSINVCSSWHG